MTFSLFDALTASGKNEFKAWTEGLQKVHRGKLNARLDMLRLHGDTLFPGVLTGTDTAGVLKLRVKSNVQLRPMLCKGPVHIESEFTLLLGAKEVGGELKPPGADSIAGVIKEEVIALPATRRRDHERVS